MTGFSKAGPMSDARMRRGIPNAIFPPCFRKCPWEPAARAALVAAASTAAHSTPAGATWGGSKRHGRRLADRQPPHAAARHLQGMLSLATEEDAPFATSRQNSFAGSSPPRYASSDHQRAYGPSAAALRSSLSHRSRIRSDANSPWERRPSYLPTTQVTA